MAEHTHSLSDRAVMGTAMFSQGASVYLALIWDDSPDIQ
jgi:hypothetical protein